jgi:DNA-binding helix-hairpin-helix protein with protein kinase domain
VSSLPAQVQNSLGRAIRLGKQLGKGGEGAVYEAVNQNDIALKIYWPTKAADRREKIAAMISAGWFKSSSFVTFPVDVLYAGNAFVGFIMKKVSGHKPIHLLYSPASRKREFAITSFRFLIRTALNVARAVASVHSTGCVIGDINHSGFLVSEKATITLIDSDSFQVSAANRNFLCTVGTPEYTPPEIQGKRFDQIKRTANHDNFGLAVLMFQLLFMGRHPFSGRYLERGDMPLERAIAEFRFAYSSRTGDTRMAPPPNVPVLADFPEYVAQAFETAFGREGVSQRPTASDWVAFLQKLEGELQNCSANPAHQHLPGKRCPFCYMEQTNPGFLAFVSGVQSTLPLQIDVRGLIAQLNSIPDPGAPPSIQSVVSVPPNLNPSSLATEIISSIRQRTLIALAASILGILVMQFGSPAGIIGLILLGIGVWVSFKPPQNLQKIMSARSQAESAWRSAQEAWNRQDGNRRFLQLRSEAEANVRLLTGLPEDERRGLQQLESKKRDNQLRRYLERFDISAARIHKIGSGRKVVLASHGIETAADVEESRIQHVPGFGPTLTSALITWRQILERKFVFNPREPVNPADIAAVKAAVGARKADLEKRLRSVVVNLQKASAYARDLRSTLARASQHAFAQLKQANLDERKAAGIFYKPMKAISLVCAVVGVLTAGSWSQVSRTMAPPGQLRKVEVEDKGNRPPTAPSQKDASR